MPPIIKVFKIELVGAKEVTTAVLDFRNQVIELSKSIKQAQKDLTDLLGKAGTQKDVTELTNKLKQLEAEMKNVRKEAELAKRQTVADAKVQKAITEEQIRLEKLRAATAKANAIEQAAAQKRVADAALAAQKILEATAKADKAALAATQAQTKAAQQATAATKAQNAALNSLIGSQNVIKAQMAQIRPFIMSGGAGGTMQFEGKQINFDQAIDEFRRLSIAEQDFRRQFSKDGTLVGEYAKGIVDAFRGMGIGDLIENQVKGAKIQLADLEQRTKDLVAAYRAAQQAGATDLNKLEKEIHDNVVETERLKKAIAQTEAQFDKLGAMGTQVSKGIKAGFADIKRQIGQFLLSYLTVQSIIAVAQKTFSDTLALDSLSQSLKVVSETEEELAINQEFLAKTTERLGLAYVDTAVAFKNFYAASTQAGISAEETRRIFESTTGATAKLRLSQDQTNGVLLAFSQIASKGKVQAEELRGQIGERVPGAFAIAARAMGVTQVQLNKMLETGTVISSEFLPKFAEELRKTFGTTQTERIEGLQAAVNRLSNAFTKMIQDNQAGFSFFFTLLIDGARILLKLLPALTIAFLTYVSAMVQGYIATQLATKGTLLYNIALFATNLRLLAVRTAVKLATYEIVLFNGAIRISPLGLFLTALGIAGAVIVAFARDTDAATRALNANNQVRQRATTIYNENTAAAKTNVDLILATESSLNTERVAMEELIKTHKLFGDVMKDGKIDYEKLVEASEKYAEAMWMEAQAVAGAQLAAEKKAKLDALNLAETRIVRQLAFNKAPGATKITGQTQTEKDIIAGIPNESLLRTIKGDVEINGIRYRSADIIAALRKQRIEAQNEFLAFENENEEAAKRYEAWKEKNIPKDPEAEVDIVKLKAAIDALQKQIDAFKGAKVDLDKLLLERDKLQAQLDDLLNKKKKGGGGGPKADKLSVAEKNEFKEIDAIRDRDLAHEEIYYANKFEIEADYLKEVRDINLGALDAKIAILQAEEARNAEENKQLEAFRLDRIEIIKATNKKLFDLEEKAAEDAMTNALAQAELFRDALLADPEITEVGRLNANEEFLNLRLAQQHLFNDRMLQMAEVYQQDMKEVEQKGVEAVRAIYKEMDNLRLQRPAAVVADIRTQGARGQAAADIGTSIATTDILKGGFSDFKTARKLEELANKMAQDRLKREMDTAAEVLKVKQDFYLMSLLSEKEYQEALADYKTKEAAATKASIDNQLTSWGKLTKTLKGVKDQFLEAVFGIKQYTNDTEGDTKKRTDAIAGALQTTQKLINDVYDNYFKREEERIEKQLEFQQDFLDREEERVKAQAQSDDERATISRKYDQMRRDAEKKAFEEKKKLALKQATIDLALAITKAFAQFGWPYGLIPAAAATAAYLVQRSAIASQQFAEGGKVEPAENGKIPEHRRNIRATPAGDNVLATVRTGEVILNKQQQAALGGPHTFKRIGVPGFATGGLAPQLGTGLTAPEFTARTGQASQFINAGEDGINKLTALVQQVAEAVYATDNKPVILNPNAVTKQQKRTQKDVSLAAI